jgi:hypothetical protein
MLLDAVEIICRETQWGVPPLSPEGSYAFALEGDISFRLFSLDGRHLFMESVIFSTAPGSAPDAEQAARLLKINAARVLRQQSVLALEEKSGALVLFRKILLKDASEKQLLQSLEDFLNDAAFWQTQALSGNSGYSPASPFSLPGRL